MNEDEFRELDQFDRKILNALAEDGRMSITDLARRVGLSNTPCQLRLKRLLAEGYIEGFDLDRDVSPYGRGALLLDCANGVGGASHTWTVANGSGIVSQPTWRCAVIVGGSIGAGLALRSATANAPTPRACQPGLPR